MTHRELIRRAAKWLRSAAGCTVVMTRPAVPGLYDVPDAIGWRGRWSVRVECRTTRRSLMRTLAALGRRSGDGSPGSQRFFLVPAGEAKAADLPDGWGLLECRPHSVRVTRCAAPLGGVFDLRRADGLRNEIALLAQTLRRTGHRRRV